MKNKIICVMAIILAGILTGCGSEKETEQEVFSTLYIEKNGSIVGQIVEDFDEEYYDIDELKNMIQESIDEYNKSAGENRIAFKECEKVDNAVSVKIEYDSSDDYEAYNGTTLFYGTIEDAYNAGYDLSIKLIDPVMNSTITKDELLNMGEKHIVISDETVHIKAYNDILYLSENVNKISEKEAFLTASDSLGIIIIK